MYVYNTHAFYLLATLLHHYKKHPEAKLLVPENYSFFIHVQI